MKSLIPGPFYGARRAAHPVRLLLALAALFAVGSSAISAQTLDDGIMISKLKLCTGVFYSYDYWDRYWRVRSIASTPTSAPSPRAPSSTSATMV